MTIHPLHKPVIAEQTILLCKHKIKKKKSKYTICQGNKSASMINNFWAKRCKLKHEQIKQQKELYGEGKSFCLSWMTR